MEKIIPISDLQTKTKEVVEGVKKTGDPVIITQRGRPAALVVNYEEYEGMLHTLDEMSYPDWQERLKEAEEDSRKGRGITLENLKKKVLKKRMGSSGRRQVSSKG
jgi:prevent-host-death family protein